MIESWRDVLVLGTCVYTALLVVPAVRRWWRSRRTEHLGELLGRILGVAPILLVAVALYLFVDR